MDDCAREDIMRTAEQVREQAGRCNSTPPGYNVRVYCDRPAGHHGRHECDTISWPGQ